MNKLKIITAYTPDKFSDIVNITKPRLEFYCEKHGFSFLSEILPDRYERPHSWAKIKLILSEISKNSAEYYLWIDADAVILNTEFNPLSFIEEGKDIFLSKDFNNINFGVVMFKSGDYLKMILEEIWNKEGFINNPCWEQAAFIEMVRENLFDLQSHIKYVPQNIFNAYEHSHYSVVHPEGEVCNETFIFHTPSLNINTRESLIKKYDKQFRTY